MQANDKVLVLGSGGLVGGAIFRNLKEKGFTKILAPRRAELNLFNQQETLDYFNRHRPQHVILAAAKVGGIMANNQFRADFIFENLSIEVHAFEAAFKSGVDRFLFLGSSCIYPRNCAQPIKEEYLLSSALERTNEPYAIAKIAGLKMAEAYKAQYGKNYFSVMPTNIYGPGDNFDFESSHVIPGLIARMQSVIDQKGPVFQVWGTGRPKREFLYVDDLARACTHLLGLPMEKVPFLINVGYGEDISIADLVLLIKEEMGFQGKIEFDHTRPDGTPQKLLDVQKINDLGWRPEVDLKEGLRRSIKFYRESQHL